MTLANPANGFTAQVQSGALQVSAGSDTWDMSLLGLGYGGAVQPVGTAQTSASGNRVDINYGTVDEWYFNGPGGLEQGFTVAPAAAGRGLPASLTVELALGGDLTGTVNAAGDGLTLTRPDGSAALGYTGLVAYDATGKALPASLEVRAGGASGTVDPRQHGRGPGPDHHRPVRAGGQAHRVRRRGGRHSATRFRSAATRWWSERRCHRGGNGQGAAYVFTESGSGWAHDPDRQAHRIRWRGGDDFGYSVAISGNTMVVGAPYARSEQRGQGAAYVFTEPGSGWANLTQTAKLTASDGATGDHFGNSVSISGNTVVVGARCATVGSNSPGGGLRVHEPGSGWANMTQTAKLTASDGAAATSSATRFRSAATRWWSERPTPRSAANIEQGAAYVFTEPGTGWTNMTQTAKLTASDGAAGDISAPRFRSAATRWWSVRRTPGRRQHTGGGLRVHGARLRLDEHDPDRQAHLVRWRGGRRFRQVGCDQRQYGGGRSA